MYRVERMTINQLTLPIRNMALALAFLFLTGIINAQKKNHLSVDPFLPIFGTIQLQYERAVNNKMSMGLSVGAKTSSGVFAVSGIEGDKISTNEFNFKGIKILPEFRWYIERSKDGLSGFYTGIYLKYQNFEDAITGVYIDSNQIANDIEIDANIQTFAGGLEIGYKLMVRERFFIDFVIAGPGISTNKIKLLEKQAIPKEFYEDLSNELSQYGFFDWLDPDFRINGNQDTDIVLPAFRYGVKIGYTF